MRAATTSVLATLALALVACGDSGEGESDSTAASGGAGAGGADVCFDEGKSFDGEARLYIEHNATDEDTGVHGMFDQEGLAKGCLETPDGTQIMLVEPTNRLGELGINEFFFESREPPNDEYSVADLKADFPEGDYRLSGIDFEGTKRVGTAVFTHDIPAPPRITSPKVVPEENGEQNEIPSSRLTVRWDAVTETIDGDPVDVAGYEVIVTDTRDEPPNSLSLPEYDVHVPPDQTELAVPEGFLRTGTLYELEVLALDESGNQTISLGFFTAS